MKNDTSIKILAIETSCDETAAAVIGDVNGKPVILSSVVSSQIDLHAKTGGVVPEVASRAHMEAIIPVIEQALLQANPKSEILNAKQIQNSNIEYLKIASDLELSASDLLQDITHIAVTAGPGLIGSLLVGFNTAKSLAYALGIPIVPINHIEGHIYSAFGGENPKSEILKAKQIQNSNIENLKIASDLEFSASDFPLIALTVSGGHTSLTLMRDHGVYENIGSTLDDAAGEAFDKVAKLLDLGYPGGPALSKAAAAFRATSKRTGVVLPLPLAQDSSFNFSYSGLKTSVLAKLRKAEVEFKDDPERLDQFKQELAAVFEETAVAHLLQKTLKAAEKYKPKSIVLAGGVSANKHLREELIKSLASTSSKLLLPPMEMTGDNAAMIGLAAYYHISRGDISGWNDIKVNSNYRL